MFVLFFLLWIIFNGRVTLEIVIFGLAISAALYWFLCTFMDLDLKTERKYLRKSLLFLRYFYCLVKEVIHANVAAMKLVVSSRQKVEPCIVQFDTDLKTELSKFLLANSITLTPGTITVSVEGSRFTVHCLDKSMSIGMEDSAFVHLLRQIEKECK